MFNNKKNTLLLTIDKKKKLNLSASENVDSSEKKI